MDEFPRSGDHFSSLAPHERDGVLRVIAHPALGKISKAINDPSFFIVGGAIRNALLGKFDTDIDLATSLTPIEIVGRLSKAGIRVIDVGMPHGTVAAHLDGENFEISTFRVPTKGAPVTQDPIVRDLSARDFTVNSIAFVLGTKILLDPFCGIDDLRAGVIRCVGSPEDRFIEDPHRILRLIRLGPASGRSVDVRTRIAAEACCESLNSVSVERNQAQLAKIVMSPYPAEAFRMMKDLRILEVLLPEVLPSIGFEQNEFHVHDVFEHTLWVMERCRADSKVLRLSALFHDLGKPHTLSIGDDGRRHFYDHETVSTRIAQDVMRRLRFSNDDTDSVATIVRYHMRPIDCGMPGVRRLLRDLGDLFGLWREFKAADSPPVLGEKDFSTRAVRFDSMVAEEFACRQKAHSDRLAINGNDIMALGIPYGPKVGELLRYLNELVIEDPEMNKRETLLEKALLYCSHSGLTAS